MESVEHFVDTALANIKAPRNRRYKPLLAIPHIGLLRQSFTPLAVLLTLFPLLV